MSSSSTTVKQKKKIIMGPHGINRAVRRIMFSGCQNGLGVTVIGGYREQTEEEYGVYIKRILPGGVAAIDDRLQSGDLILEVNGENLVGVTNERAVDMLRMASASNHMSLLIARDDEARREFTELLEKYGSHSNAGSARSSPTPVLGGKLVDNISSGSSSRSPSPQLLSPKDVGTNYSGTNAAIPAHIINDSAFQLISVAKETGLGLNIVGGINRTEGPMVYVQEIIPGGDCYKDGRLKAGDQLVSVNKESLIGVSYEEAKSILTRTKLRMESTVEIAFIKGKCASNQWSSPQSPLNHLSINGNGHLLRPTGLTLLLPPPGNLVPKMSSVPASTKTGCRKGDQSTVRSPDSSPTDLPSTATAPNQTQGGISRRKKISLNPVIQMKVEKLEMALNYLGIQPTEEQRQTLRQKLQIDSKGTVSYGEFEQAAREIFSLQLSETGTSQNPMMFSANEIANLFDSAHPSQLAFFDSLELDDIENLKKERNEVLKEIKKLKEKLAESESCRKQLSEELHKVKQEAKAAVEETRALRSRIHLAEAAQRQARGMEMDYEEVIRLLEAEITQLKAQFVDQPGQTKDDVQDLKKRTAVLECQLRKSEIAKKTFEVSSEKLLQFVEVVHEVLSENPNCSVTDRRLAMSSPSQALLARLGRNGPGATTTTALALEAKEIAKSVRSLLEVDCLPYGWEEAYTADGIKYFINHVTQTTSWIHPVASTLSLPCLDRNGDELTRALSETKS
ncbi:syntaxin-binding protein 4 isoform X2 [Latimeria chalumnae]|uniref:syntaxin-binding protein 4 isoform X2 n=1 Tax=Latimeria chalumnae TaxID=7897 RepID=UPI0003C1A0CC|nr:PREDICTED: syntaxin-binding protein 4 isoform X2 [Latimeria chalumnae]|eukprot:XP_006000000.1 PREDICTED: syntaxin-binding protein 4 isoform X2 [Latimeria chalumnae]